MGKLIGRLTKKKQELRKPIPMHGEWGQGGWELGGHNASRGTPWETARNASANAWRVTERNIQQECARQLDTQEWELLNKVIGGRVKGSAQNTVQEFWRVPESQKCMEVCKDVQRYGNWVAEFGCKYFCQIMSAKMEWVLWNITLDSDSDSSGRGLWDVT